MRHRALLALVPLTGAALVLAAPAAHADQGPLCSGTPANQAAYFCIVEAHLENLVPEVTVTSTTIPQFCVVNPVCVGPLAVPLVPGATLDHNAAVILYWNNTCLYVYSDGTVVKAPGSVDSSNPPMPNC